jgi:linoleoyl-CoA desaturase
MPVTSRSSDSLAKPRFEADQGFYQELKRRVEEYFQRTGASPRDNLRMYFKTATILVWFAASYLLLICVATTWWQAGLLSLSLALATAGVGFCIQHDANHGAYSRFPAMNQLMGLTLDLLGASSYVWHWKHNIAHHTYTNVNTADDDIDLGFLCRLAPTQRRRRIHRLQQFYMWLLYGFLMPMWHFFYDFQRVSRARVGRSRFPRPKGWDLVKLIGGKALFFGWALVLPLCFHRWWVVLVFYAVTSFALGLILSVVFQLAHCVEEANFPGWPHDPGPAKAWAVHEVETTVNFARRNRLLTWYLGGLNYQVEHHLFPKVCHVHYPRLAPIVQGVCREYGVRYSSNDRLLTALGSHWRWLRQMGRPQRV